MILNAHAGTKYGVSFPVLCRASFGVRGANVPAHAARDRRVRMVRHPDVDRRRWRWTRCCARRGPAGPACPARRLDRVRACSGWCRSRSSSAASRASRCSRAGRRRCCSAAARCCCWWAIARGGGLGHILSRVGAAAAGQHAVLALFPGGAHRQRRLLGDAEPEHSRLHPLRAQPALAGARPGAGAAGDDDGVRVHRRGGHERDDRDLRRGDLGSGRADRADRQRRRSSSSARSWCSRRSSRPTWPPTSCRRPTTSRAWRRSRISYVTGGLITAVHRHR